MVDKILADASPQKRLFISLITRDISLTDAILDLIDNSINAALVPLADHLKTADDYQRLLANTKVTPAVKVDLTIGSRRIFIRDTASGISIEAAEKHAFRFGPDDGRAHESDRLSVYGIGLKRAMFKCGNKINMVSDHRNGGFELNLNARRWAKEDQEDRDKPWRFEITVRPAAAGESGTRIAITELHDDVVRRPEDGLFLQQLKERIASTYSFFIGRVVEITVNDSAIEKESFEIGDNYISEKFLSNGVSCNITAGIAAARGDTFRDRNAGWFVFCNGRTVLAADKSSRTGWGAGGALPIFQPKHRPFLGTVFFVSADPEALPWTTTKAGVNEELAVWQEARRHMVTVGRVITGFLDSRYTEEGAGAGIAPAELQDASGRAMNVLTAAVAPARSFTRPRVVRPTTIKIQYEALFAYVQKIEAYLRRPGMGGSEVGGYTFNWFLKNEVGEDK
jgi:hypothetical protein